MARIFVRVDSGSHRAAPHWTRHQLDDDEQELVTSALGIILSEDGQGFVTVDYYKEN